MAHSQSELRVITFAKNLCSYVMTITQASPKQHRFALARHMKNQCTGTCENRLSSFRALAGSLDKRILQF